jgi:DNA-binding MltR family transcriptional regulator
MQPSEDHGTRFEDNLVRIAVDAYQNAGVDQLLDIVSKRKYDYGKATAFFSSCDKESDRATPVLIFSFIENAMRELFAEELSPDTPGGVSSLFDPFGPLSTTSAQIKMLSALEWISPKTAKNLDLIRKIRNQFAHDPPEDGFHNKKIRSLIESMHPFEAPILDPSFLKGFDLPLIDSSQLGGRVLFVSRAALTFSHMAQELMTHPKEMRMGLPKGATLARGHKKLPATLSDAALFGIRVLLRAVFPDVKGRW